MAENEWTLWSFTPRKDYPSVIYFWIDPNSVVKYCRSIEPIGFMPLQLDFSFWINRRVNLKYMNKFGCKKVTNGYAKMTQEELSQGCLTH